MTDHDKLVQEALQYVRGAYMNDYPDGLQNHDYQMLCQAINALGDALKEERTKSTNDVQLMETAVQDARKAIGELEASEKWNDELQRKNADLKRKLDEENALVWRLLKQVKDLKRTGKILHDAYMDIRKEVNSFETEYGGHDRFEVTLEKVRNLKHRLEGGHAENCCCHEEDHPQCEWAAQGEKNHRHPYIDPRCIALREGR